MTHINAFQADVDEKKRAVVAAQGELEVAQAALEAHEDYVAPKKEAKVEAKVVKEEAPVKVKKA